MNITAVKISSHDVVTDLLVLPMLKTEKKLPAHILPFDKKLNGLLTELLRDKSFVGKKGESVVLHSAGTVRAKRIMLLGLGGKKINTLDMREVAAEIIKRATKEAGVKTVAVMLPESLVGSGSRVKELGSAIAEGALLGAYEFSTYHNDERKQEIHLRKITDLTLVVENAGAAKNLQAGLEAGFTLAEATIVARDLVNTPSADMTPRHLVEVATALAKKNKNISLEYFDEEQASAMGMGAFCGVAKGSDEPSYFIHLTYKPSKSKTKAKKIFLCGKGITFDTGGISLKPASALESSPMHCDMSGAAAILGVFSVLHQLNISDEVHAVLPCTENMPSGKALKPHDILRAMNGKTIEVINTDAEGRLVLADALSFAVKNKADVIIDLATLTGACVLALGSDYAGLFSNNQKLADQIKTAAENTGEHVWQLPMPEQYKRGIKSPVADLKNIGPRYDADAITAALFIQEFANKTPWVHLDIAGPAWVDNTHRPSVNSRGTGFGTRLIINFLTNN